MIPKTRPRRAANKCMACTYFSFKRLTPSIMAILLRMIFILLIDADDGKYQGP